MEFPAVIERGQAGESLRDWLQHNARRVDTILDSTGSVLLRGFGVTSAAAFRDAVAGPLAPLIPYIEGASPRSPLGGDVYTSTEYAHDQPIALHNELSYSTQWPGRVAFCCARPAAHGGQTPIADSRRVYDRIVASCPQPVPLTVRYVRHMHDGKGPGVSWPVVFGTSDAAQVADYCRKADIDHAWRPNRVLRTSQTRPAAIIHPRTGERIWFNQAHQWHPSNGGPEAETLWRELFGDELPMTALHGDGTEIDAASLGAVRDAYQAEQVVFDWQEGDVLILDNMLTAHGRAPFTGARDVLVAMGRPVRLDQVKAVTTHA